MYSEFSEFNSYVYHSAHGAVLDFLIWCLGPYVDDSREYGTLRIFLANTTRVFVRRCYRIQD